MENYTSDSSDSDNNSKVIDYAYLLLPPEEIQNNLEKILEDSKKTFLEVENLILHHNRLSFVPPNVFKFSSLKTLDISNNGLTVLDDVFKYCSLTTLVAKNNNLTNESLPKSFTNCSNLKEINLSGNNFTQFPDQVLALVNVKFLYLGGNRICSIPTQICKLSQLQILSMGGNNLKEVPASLGQLKKLQALMLCDNEIEHLPANIANLHQLKSLLLHKNRLRTLPPEIIALKNLTELSLRDNPLVVRFVSDMTHNPGSLLELAARSVKCNGIPFNNGDIPVILENYLNSAHHCVNPRCEGVYFDNRVEHIKFVDFCGKYRIPLLQYLCSSKCATGGEENMKPCKTLMKKVLLG